jgi:hypothetical protein
MAKVRRPLTEAQKKHQRAYFKKWYANKKGRPIRTYAWGGDPAKTAARQARFKAWLSTPQGKKAARESQKRSEARYPEKYFAREKFRDAVKRGKIKRQPCETCGESKSHGHHEDYSKPLEVKWLCHKHHAALHKELRAKR